MGTRIGQVRIRANTDDALATRMRGEAALRALDLEPASMPARMILCIRAMPDPMPGGVDLRSAHAPRPIEWERAARGAVNDALRRAVRPAHNIVPSDTDAVLFADHAELLACAAREAGNGFLAAWWWPHLLRGTSVESVVFEWQRRPQYVAAAMELLARSGDVVPFVRQIPPRIAANLLLQVLDTHHLATAAREVANVLATSRTAATSPIPLPRSLAIPGLRESTGTVEQQLFAIATLAIRRLPSLLRSPEAARALFETIAPTQSTPPRTATGTPHPTPTIEAREEHTPASEPATKPNVPNSLRTEHPQTTSPPAHNSEPSDTETENRRVASNEHRATPQKAKPPDIREGPANDRRPNTGKTQTPSAQRPTPTPLPDTIATRHAGVFFLLNLATALGLYDPYGREIPLDLDVWDFLALTSRALVPEIEDDEVWPLLTALAQRTEDDPLPPLDDELLARVRQSLALVIEDEDAAAFVIHQPGHIAVSAAHLDVTFCLAAHPIEIRIAGLDRDPGWIPAAGRHVDFHFD
jgi:hypothetical protein